MAKKKEKEITIDMVYYPLMLFFVGCIWETRKFIDICYLILITVYYLRIKIHRWKKYH